MSRRGRSAPKWPREVQEFWNAVTARWRLTEEGAELLKLACEARARMLECDRVLKRDGLVITTGRGVARAHPAVSVRSQAEMVFLRSIRDIGLES